LQIRKILRGTREKGELKEAAEKETNKTMNGERNYTPEQNRQYVLDKENFRDRVSKDMGDLLLRGYTMLNEYCDICKGILMSNREGIRNCVACDVVRQQRASSLEHVPSPQTSRPSSSIVKHETEPYDSDVPDEVLIENDSTGPQQQRRFVLSSVGHLNGDEKSTSRIIKPMCIKAEKLGYKPNAAFAENKEQSMEEPKKKEMKLEPRNVILSTIQAKVMWANDRLKTCEDPDYCIKYMDVIYKGFQMMESLKY